VSNVLKGERVSLRAIEEGDYPEITAFLNNLAVHVLADDEAPVPKSQAQVRSEFADLLKKPEELVCFAIEVDGVLVGTCSVHQFDFTAHRCAIGISIDKSDYWGRGYGREAISLLLDYAFRHRNFHRVWLTVRSDNIRAIHTYEKCGFVTEGVLRDHIWSDGSYRDWILMGILRREWAERSPA
jgi:RimJ/RimL family protein N-acetyltransferase